MRWRRCLGSTLSARMESFRLFFNVGLRVAPWELMHLLTRHCSVLFTPRRTGAKCHNDCIHCLRWRWRVSSRKGLPRPSESPTSQRYRSRAGWDNFETTNICHPRGQLRRITSHATGQVIVLLTKLLFLKPDDEKLCSPMDYCDRKSWPKWWKTPKLCHPYCKSRWASWVSILFSTSSWEFHLVERWADSTPRVRLCTQQANFRQNRFSSHMIGEHLSRWSKLQRINPLQASWRSMCGPCVLLALLAVGTFGDGALLRTLPLLLSCQLAVMPPFENVCSQGNQEIVSSMGASCLFVSQMHLNNAELLDWCKEKGIHVTAYGE